MRNESLQGGDTTIFRLCQAACGSFTARRILHCARSTRARPRAEAAGLLQVQVPRLLLLGG